MKKTSKAITAVIAFVALLALSLQINGCSKPNDNPSLYNPNWQSLPQPVVDSLTPAGTALAGVDTITVYGKNFSANRDSDGVYFNSTLIYNTGIISASSTKLTLLAPALSGDTIQVRVYVIGSVDFSATYRYRLLAAIAPFGKLGSGDEAFGLTMGADSSLYASLSNPNLTGTKDEGVFQFASDGSITPYTRPLTGNVYWTSLKFGPGGYLYAAKGVRAMYRFSPGSGNSAQIWTTIPSGSFADMDFDPSHNLWVGGNNKEIYMITQNAVVKGFPFAGIVHAVRYFDGSLYFAASVGSAPTQVFKAPIINDSLGTPEVYYDLSTDPTGGNNIYAITFSADGDMYAGVDSSDYLIVVHPGGSISRPYSLYIASGVLNSPVKSFAWIGTDLYASTESGELLKIEPRKQGAPYYGLR